MCARHGKGAIEICFSEKGALAKKKIGKHWVSSLEQKLLYKLVNKNSLQLMFMQIINILTHNFEQT